MQVLRGHAGRVRGLAYSPDGETLATCGNDRTVRLWDPVAATERAVFAGHPLHVCRVAFSLDGRTLISVNHLGGARAWDVATGEVRLELPRTSDRESLALNPRLLDLLVGGSAGPRTEGQRRSAEATGFLVAGVWPRPSIRYREAGMLPRLREFVGREPRNPEEVTMALAGRRCSFDLPASPRGTLAGSFVPGSGASMNYSYETLAAISPDGQTLAISHWHELHLWFPREQSSTRLDGHSNLVRALAFSPDGRQLASGGHDGTIRLWDVPEGVERANLGADLGMIGALAFAPDGMTLAAAGRAGVAVWDVEERL